MARTKFYPGIGVGDVKFGIAENELPPSYQFTLIPELSEPMDFQESFESEKFGMRADFEKGRLTLISCEKSLVFKGSEIIGSSFKSLEGLIINFKQVPDEDEILIGDGVQHIIYVDELGLGFWLDEGDSVRSVDCMAPWV